MPVVEVQASPEDVGASTRLDYYRQILDQLRSHHVAVNDRVRHLTLLTHPGKKSSDPAEWLDMRVERAAARDSVGDQVQTLISPKCTFSGVVPIELKHFLDSSVALVECPNCARTRSLEPRSGVLRFPAHDKRKTHTPNTEQRWVMEQTIWEVVGGESK